jgi:7-cyano-7-deazaguanine reductase
VERRLPPAHIMPSKLSKDLETFSNPNPERDYEISFEAPEFTCLCPMTGQPDFATIRIRYVPDEKCVELKSLKLYLWSFRDQGTFHEAVTNRIANDLIAAIDPRFIEVEGDFYIRGGIKTKVKVEHRKPQHRAERASVR